MALLLGSSLSFASWGPLLSFTTAELLTEMALLLGSSLSFTSSGPLLSSSQPPGSKVILNFNFRLGQIASEHAFKEILTSLPKPGGGEFGKFYSLPALNDPRIDRLPYSIRILLESAIRNCDNFQVTKEDVEKIIDWENTSPKLVEIPFKPARVLLQVNLEYLGRVVFNTDGLLYPDSVVGTDSHTTMIDGLGVAGWGIGGIKAEAAMLGQKSIEMAELEARREQVKLNVARKVGGPDLKSFIQQFEGASKGSVFVDSEFVGTGEAVFGPEFVFDSRTASVNVGCRPVSPVATTSFITRGANKGIGLEICRQLASNGIAVILTARDEKKGTEAVQGSTGNF
ncbi:hypothetical protein EZV62_008879 [Acer yangbiense]|uniref:Aconitase/3-isopropylmalate dehydratase large subunit alpha/beta/alpha domain-containing protein n=1 Tax=Acer yangbiense TaxID=1000413 RepID=A0A5C7IF34_9ROSI|nr:hypothetical protein EZV62_008879 [Acer yangbiense]